MLPLFDERWFNKEYILVTDTMDFTDLGVEDHFLTNIYRAEILLQPQLLAPGSFTKDLYTICGRETSHWKQPSNNSSIGMDKLLKTNQKNNNSIELS